MYWSEGAQPRWGNEDFKPKPMPEFSEKEQDAAEALSDLDSLGNEELDKIMVDTYISLIKSYRTAARPESRVDGFAAGILGMSKAAVACFIPLSEKTGEIALSAEGIGEHIEMLARNITNTITNQVQMMRAEAEIMDMDDTELEDDFDEEFEGFDFDDGEDFDA